MMPSRVFRPQGRSKGATAAMADAGTIWVWERELREGLNALIAGAIQQMGSDQLFHHEFTEIPARWRPVASH